MEKPMMGGAMGAMDEEGEMGMCVKIHANPDGTYLVSKSEQPAPKDGQPAADMDEAMMMAKDMMMGGMEGMEDEDEMMKAAQSGYNKKAKPMMSAPNPEGVFGE